MSFSYVKSILLVVWCSFLLRFEAFSQDTTGYRFTMHLGHYDQSGQLQPVPSDGYGVLQKVFLEGPNDTVRVAIVTDGNFSTQHIPEGTYTFHYTTDAAFSSESIDGMIDTVKLVSTFYPGEIRWQNMDTIEIFTDVSDTMIVQRLNPTLAKEQTIVRGIVQSQGDQRQRMKEIGVLLFELDSGSNEINDSYFYHSITNENGEFIFEGLRQGNYRLEVQYPGIAMDNNSFVQFNTTALCEESPIYINIFSDAIEADLLGWDNPCVLKLSERKLTIFPNPTQQTLYVERGLVDQAPFRILSLTGITQVTGILRSGEQSIDIQDLPAGTYLFNYIGQAVKFVKK